MLIWRATRIVNFAQGGDADDHDVHRLGGDQRDAAPTGSGFAVALVSGLVLGAVVERVLIRRVEGGPPLNAVIVTLGLLHAAAWRSPG